MKKGQLWYADFAIGMLVIILISVAFYFVLFDIGNINSTVRDLEFAGENVANYLMSDGYGDWAEDVVGTSGKIGIVNNGKIDNELYDKFRNLNSLYGNNEDTYTFTKEMFGVIYLDYTAHLTFKDGSKMVLADFLPDADTIFADNMIVIDRLVYYNVDGDANEGEIVKLSVVVYR
jgi:hypothetical protein